MTESGLRPEQIHGTWRLTAATAIDRDGQPIRPPYGPIPMGRIIFNRDGRMMAVVCDGRPELPSGETRGYASYCGNFCLEGDVLITRVDAAARAERVGGEQRRRLELRDGQLVLIPARRPDGEQRELVWTRDGDA